MGESGAGDGGRGDPALGSKRLRRGSDIIAGGGAAQRPQPRGFMPRLYGVREPKKREEEQEMKSAGTISPPLRIRIGKLFTISSNPHCHLSLPPRPVASHACCVCARPQGREHRPNYNVRDAPRCREPLTRGSVGAGLHGTRSTRHPHQCEP